MDPEGYFSAPRIHEAPADAAETAAIADVRESVPPDQHLVPVVLRDPYHQPHLQNYFDAIRGKAELTCPPDVSYETAVAVLKVKGRHRVEDPAVVQAGGLQGPGSVGMEGGRWPLIAITILRVVVGWHFLYEGIVKLTADSWSAAGYLRQSRGPFAGVFRWIASDANLLANADLITMWGLTIVGVLLILGLFTKIASLAGTGSW